MKMCCIMGEISLAVSLVLLQEFRLTMVLYWTLDLQAVLGFELMEIVICLSLG